MHHDFIPRQGLRPTGEHHEIYLSDLHRTAAEEPRAMLRQPSGSPRQSPIRSHNWSFLIGVIRPTVETWSGPVGRLNLGGS